MNFSSSTPAHRHNRTQVQPTNLPRPNEKCETPMEVPDDEIQRIFARLADGGEVFMHLGDYGFSTRFGWVGDRHGVTWQLNLA